MQDKFMGTGRTTRMLQFAIDEARNDKVVIVYCHDPSEMIRLVRKALELDCKAKMAGFPAINMEVRFSDSTGYIVFEGARKDEINLDTLRKGSVHRDVVTLLDHYTIETWFLRGIIGHVTDRCDSRPLK